MLPISENSGMVPPGMQPLSGTIPLATLIDLMVQQTYHDLTVMAELLPRKTDMERKIAIAEFASKTRQMFVRLLAIVKWASSVSKVEKCGRMATFLDEQQQLFVETADSLARMARETLVHARLPSFSLPCAVDVLTTGTYPRLPFCIKEKIVPPDLITPAEKKETLERLTQIIEYRIVSTELPAQMCNPKIGNGKVKFTVEHEFEVTLTLMGDDPNIPWRLLDIEILVDDPETGSGQALVHSLQVNYIHQLIQSRLLENDKPLHELYDCLHSFCQSLQLEVLHTQTQALIGQRGLGESLKVEKYEIGKRLSLSYWRDPVKKENKMYQSAYKLEVHLNSDDRNKPLQISHFPHVQGSESTKIPLTIQSDCLSIEKFFVHTIQVRSIAKLKDLERELRLVVIGQCEVKDVPVVLLIPLLTPCLSCEKLCIAVDMMRGTFLVSLAQKETPMTKEVEDCLNLDKKDLKRSINNLRYWLMLERCRKSLQHLPAIYYNELPLINSNGHALEALNKNKLFVRLPMQLDYYLVIEVVEKSEKKTKKPFYNYYLLNVKREGLEGEGQSSSSLTTSTDVHDTARFFLRAGALIKLDVFALTRGQGGKIIEFETDDSNDASKKQKLKSEMESNSERKRIRGMTYFISELTHIIAFCEDRIPLMALAEELTKRGISHTGVKVDGKGVGLSLSLLNGLTCKGIREEVPEMLKNSLLSFTFRIQRREKTIWMVENVFTNHPIATTNIHEKGSEHCVYYGHDKLALDEIDKTVDKVLADWNAIAQLYSAVVDFDQSYKDLQKEVEMKSYNYKQLTLCYASSKCYTVSIQYNMSEDRFRLFFGTVGPAMLSNCHTLIATYLEKDLNNTKSIGHLVKILLRTSSVLSSICKLNTSPVVWIKKDPMPIQMFTVIPVSSTHFRLIYRGVQCIDVQCLENRHVSVRDGAYSVFDTGRSLDGLSPIYGLQIFLNLFIDDSVTECSVGQMRRRVTADEDNPPSPVVMDTMDAFLASASSNPPHSTAAAAVRSMIIAPSPSNILSPSPGNASLLVPSSPSSFLPAASPVGMHMPSPANSFINSQGMVETGGSPYPGSGLMPSSSVQRMNWPGSPLMLGPSPVSRGIGMAPSPGYPSPSQHKDNINDHNKPAPSSLSQRTLHQRPWAALAPTILSHEAFDKLFTPTSSSNTNNGQTTGMTCCPLERFLGCTFLKRHMLRIISSEEGMTNIPITESGVLMFKVDSGLQCRLFLNPSTLQSLNLKITPEIQTQWDAEELAVLEKFFQLKVDCQPYRPNPMRSFAILLKAPLHVLKDFVQIMRMEIVPSSGLKWSVQWCMTIPHGFGHMNVTAGHVSVTIASRKVFFMLHLTKLNGGGGGGSGSGTGNSESLQNILLPVLYDMSTNVTSTIDQKGLVPANVMQTLVALFKNSMDFHVKPNECSIFPCVRDIINNLSV